MGDEKTKIQRWEKEYLPRSMQRFGGQVDAKPLLSASKTVPDQAAQLLSCQIEGERDGATGRGRDSWIA